MKPRGIAGAEQALVGPVILWASSGRLGEQVGHSDQVVRGGGELGPQLIESDPAVAQLATPAHRLHPAIDLLDPLAHPLAPLVARRAGGAAVDGAPLPGRPSALLSGLLSGAVVVTRTRCAP